VIAQAAARVPARAAQTCANCRHFRSDPRELEARIPGLLTFGSAHASVRADDGLCVVHDRYLSAASSCATFAARFLPQAQRNAV